MQRCAICRSSTNAGCSKCRQVYYCSLQHQKKHWQQQHKYQCPGKPSKVLESEYNTENLVSRKSSPQRYRQSKEKRQDEIKESTKSKEIQLIEKIHQFVENTEERKEVREKILIEYAKGKEELLIGRANQLMQFSQEIFKEFDNSMCRALVQKFKIRTSKYIQELECFLDICFLTKLYLKAGMREELKRQVYSLKLPSLPDKVSILNHNDPHQLDAYKLWKQEVKYCKIALSLIASIANAGGFYSYTENVYKLYIHLVEKSFGVNEQFLAYFLVGNWYTENREYNKAKACYEYCVELKKNESNEEEILGDCYFNIALCYRMMDNVNEGINQMHYSLSIRRRKNRLDAAECLEFIGKQYLEIGKYNEAYIYLDECHFIRKELLKPEDPALGSIRELIKKFFLEIKGREHKEAGNISVGESMDLGKELERMKQGFEGKTNEHFYAEYGYSSEKKKMQKIRLDPEWTQWIDELGANQLSSLVEIMKKSEILPFDEGILEVLNSDFYKSLTEEKKRKFKELNPDFIFQ